MERYTYCFLWKVNGVYAPPWYIDTSSQEKAIRKFQKSTKLDVIKNNVTVTRLHG